MNYYTDIRQDAIMKYYFDNCYPKLDIYEKKDNEDSKQSTVKLCINYTEFLIFLEQTGILLQTEIYDKNKIRFKFLSYPNYIVSGKKEYLLNELKKRMDKKIDTRANRCYCKIGTMEDTKDKPEDYHLGHSCKYHVGDNILSEYIVDLLDAYGRHEGDEYFVRMTINDIERWVKIVPIIWSVDKENNLLISNNIIFQFNEEIINDNQKCVEYINNNIYSDMRWHYEQYLSYGRRLDRMIINYQFHKYKRYLGQNNNEIQPKVLKKQNGKL